LSSELVEAILQGRLPVELAKKALAIRAVRADCRLPPESAMLDSMVDVRAAADLRGRIGADLIQIKFGRSAVARCAW